jgi:Trk K+ transport system NAD-binding subunit
VNIVACAMANQFGSPQTTCFVSRDDFVSETGQHGLEHFGIDRVVWPEAQLAADIERIVSVPGPSTRRSSPGRRAPAGVPAG